MMSAGFARHLNRVVCIACFLALMACEPAPPNGDRTLQVDVTGEVCELSVSFPEPVDDVGLICGEQTMYRPALQFGDERIVVALDPDGLIPLTTTEHRASEYRVRLPLEAVRAALGTAGRFIQARWRDAEGNWALGPASHLRPMEENSSALHLSSARTILATRALPTWLYACGVLLAGVIAAVVMRRMAPRLYGYAMLCFVVVAAGLSWPAAQSKYSDLYWSPDPLFLQFVERAAAQLDELPSELGVVVSGPPELRCRASAAISTQRLRHLALPAVDSSAAQRTRQAWARLGPALEVSEEEVVLDRFGDWSLLIPSRYIAR